MLLLALLDRPGHNSLNGIANQIQDAFSKLNQARLEPLEGNTTDAGRPVKGLTVEYVNESNGQRTAFKQMGVVVKYDHYFVALFLVGPETLFDKYFPVFNMVGTLLKEPDEVLAQTVINPVFDRG